MWEFRPHLWLKIGAAIETYVGADMGIKVWQCTSSIGQLGSLTQGETTEAKFVNQNEIFKKFMEKNTILKSLWSLLYNV